MFLIVLVTIPIENTNELINKILEKKLCACVNVIKNIVEIAKMIRWMDFTEKALVKHFVLLIVRPPILTGFCNEIMCVNII